LRVWWTTQARQDRRDLISYVETEGLLIALELDERISQAVSQLQDHPYSGRPGRATGTRELVIVRTPYIAVYVVSEDAVSVVRLIHGAQRWPPADLT